MEDKSRRALSILMVESFLSVLLETLTPKSPPPSIPNFLVFGLSLDTMSPVGRGEKLTPSWTLRDAQVCSGEGDQKELDIVVDQASPGLGLAPKKGFV